MRTFLLSIVAVCILVNVLVLAANVALGSHWLVLAIPVLSGAYCSRVFWRMLSDQ
jgi:hypothetical protein